METNNVNLEVLSIPYAQDYCEEHPKPNVCISKMSITYTQMQDCSSPIPSEKEDQYITIESVGSDLADRDGIEKQENYYYTIKTDRWAINDANELSFILKDFENRLYGNQQVKTKEDEVEIQ